LAQEQRQLEQRLEEIYDAFRKTLDAYLPQLREHLQLLKEVQKKATKTTTDRPLLALGVAFLLGMAFGIALSKSRDQMKPLQQQTLQEPIQQSRSESKK
jgi:type VI protein secretion system component VasF